MTHIIIRWGGSQVGGKGHSKKSFDTQVFARPAKGSGYPIRAAPRHPLWGRQRASPATPPHPFGDGSVANPPLADNSSPSSESSPAVCFFST